MTALRRPAALLVTAFTLAAAGCGQGAGDAAQDDARGSNGDNSLAESDVAAVLDARRTIDAACGSDGGGTPDRSAAQLGDAVATLASVTEQSPDHVYETGNEDRAEKMTTISGQVSEQLRKCGVGAGADRLAKAASTS